MSKEYSKELTVIMPCLNEAETIEKCINKAKACIEKNGLNAEVLIADNGSTDGSIEIAKKCGARVVNVPIRGYGAALIEGTKAAEGKYCIMGDADDSYDFSQLMPYLEELRNGFDLVMGNRFKGGIEEGAMPPLHRYLGTPVISFIGRLFYHNNIGDFNCGMRGYNTQRIIDLGLCSTGMEYASEMIIQSALYGYRITEVPTTLSVDGRSREPYLNTWNDGWRHLKLLLINSPKWLFMIPGVFFTVLGFIMMVLLGMGTVVINSVSFDINTMLFGAGFMIVGVNLMLFDIYTKTYAKMTGYIPTTENFGMWISESATEKIILFGIILLLFGIAAVLASVLIWGKASFGDLNPQEMMRITIPAMTLCAIGTNLIFGGFMIDILKIKHF